MDDYEDYSWQLEFDNCPPKIELIPIGLYDGGDLLPSTIILDNSYIVYVQIANPEYDCEVIMN